MVSSPRMQTHEQKTSMRDVLLRTVSVLGLVAVLLLGAWGIIQLAVAIPALFSNVGGNVSTLFTPAPQKEALTVTADASVASAQSLRISWSHTSSSGEYSYNISYACESGLSLKAPLPTGSYQTVACNTPFNFVNASDHMTVIPTATKSLPLALTVIATNLSTGAVTAQGTATTNVTSATASVAVPTETTASKGTAVSKGTPDSSYSYYAAPAPQTLYGYGDLAVRINSVAPLAGQAAGNGLTAVTFTIQNIGTNIVTSGWIFNAVLPINGSYTFVSQAQRPLNPGDKVVYMLTYSGGYGYNSGYSNSGYNGYGYGCTGYVPCLYPTPSHDPIDYPNVYNYGYGNGYTSGYPYGGGMVTITADPQGLIPETTKINNVATAPAY